VTTTRDVLRAMSECVPKRSSEEIEEIGSQILEAVRSDPYVAMSLLALAEGVPEAPRGLPVESVASVTLLLAIFESLALSRERERLEARLAEVTEEVVDLRARFCPIDLVGGAK